MVFNLRNDRKSLEGFKQGNIGVWGRSFSLLLENGRRQKKHGAVSKKTSGGPRKRDH